MKKLIVNADDFGISEAVNRGIIQCFREGIVRSTSIMPNFRAFESAVALTRQAPELSVGIHLTLTAGRPLTSRKDIPHLVSGDGHFFPLPHLIKKLLLRQIPQQEIECELKAQIEKVINTGIRPTHLDTHHHVHFFPRVNRAVVKLANQFSIKRVRGTSTTLLKGLYLRPSLFLQRETYAGLMKVLLLSSLGHFSNHRPSDFLIPDPLLGIGYVPVGNYQQALLQMLSKVSAGTTELVCHPGYVDSELKEIDHWTQMREEELISLTSAETRDIIEQQGLELAN